MTLDMGQFLPVFYEEAEEHLATMEAGLLGIDPAALDLEQVNAIFRAAHSIKGGAGTFGLADVAAFTHNLETLLDRVRHGELQLDEVRVDACLAAVDLLHALIGAHKGGEAVQGDRVRALESELARLAVTERESVPVVTGGAPAQPQEVYQAIQPQPGAAVLRELRWHIDRDGMFDLAQAALLLDALGQFGALELRESPPDGTVRGSWRVALRSTVSDEDLREVVSFLLPPESVEIVPVDEGVDADPGYGLFDAEPAGDGSDPAYGFFDDGPDATVAQADAGYGFFDAPDDDAAAAAAVPEAQPAGDPGYGFFDEVPTKPPVAADPGYGLFDDLPAQAAAPDPGYGFFDAAEPSLPAADATQIEVVAVRTEPYGFFPNAPGVPDRGASAGSASEGATVAAPAPSSEARPFKAGEPAAPRAAAPTAGVAADTSIRVGTAKVDQLINLVGELVITQSMLLQSAQQLDPVVHERMLAGLAQLERNSRDLQEAVLSIRMVPMSLVFSRYPRMVRDLARKLDKQAELHLVGESTELDKGMTEKIVDPLTHLVRNSVDHGLELPAARVAAGKTPVGHITLAASHQSGHILIEISDDGGGLNRERILAKARSNGIPVNPEAPDSEVWDLIFAPGFSTAEAVTDVSGRGVGMDVVRKNIHALGGSVSLSSVTGAGTRVSIRLPLTLAILDGMSVRVGDETFIVPLGYIVESIQASGLVFRTVGRDGRVVQVREDYIPVVSLAELFEIPAASRDVTEGVLVVLESQNRKIAVGVDELLGQHQVVVKNLETNYRRVQGVSGATILGDGKVSLIIDVDGILRMAGPQAKVNQGSAA